MLFREFQDFLLYEVTRWEMCSFPYEIKTYRFPYYFTIYISPYYCYYMYVSILLLLYVCLHKNDYHPMESSYRVGSVLAKFL